MTRAIALMSGGLDSILAAKLIKDQGIDVIGVCFKSYFFDSKTAERMVKQIEIPLEVVDFSKEHFEIVKNPKHGYGKNVNPCIDCHSYMLNNAGKLMEKYNADFIITGEVLNQRPMSQNRCSLDVVKKESGFADKILRPLSAKNLKPTKMELEGLVDRDRLLDISGRGRKEQMRLAEEWGINEYPSPAGGCKLTEPGYSIRLKDLLIHSDDIKERDIELLRIGRHVRYSHNAKIISTRTADEAKILKNYLQENDLVFLAKEYKGSLVVIIGNPSDKDIELAAKIAARYSKGREQPIVEIRYGYYKKPLNNFIKVSPIKDEEMNQYILKK